MNTIPALVRTDLLIYTVVLNIIMYLYLRVNKSRTSYSTVLFRRILVSTIVVTVFEIISWSTGEIGNKDQILVHYWSNAFFLANVGLTSAFGLSYIHYKIFGDVSRSKMVVYLYLLPTYINIAFAVYNHFSRGFLFYIDEMNRYHRGLGVTLSNVILYTFAVLVFISFFRQKKLVTGRVVQVIIIYAFVPLIGSILQMIAYGTTFGMPAYTLASFMTYMLVEKDEMRKDPLTDLYTRGNLESRLRFKLKQDEAFTLMMIDLNDFKYINDTYGHLEGDRALKKVADILQYSINVEDMVCRFGGDEFVLLIENHEDVGGNFIAYLDQVLSTYNRNMNNKYQLHLSYGYEYVIKPSSTNLEELITLVDQKMYEDKETRKKSLI